MNYEVVELEEKTVVGIKARTSNTDPNMTSVIGGLWERFFAEGIVSSIANKKNDKAIGLYTNYSSDSNGEYDVMVCCEVFNQGELTGEIGKQTIKAGKYAKFVVKGHMQKAVAECWMKLWELDLDRKFSCDFEEYQSGGDMDNAEIHIYIALN